MSATSIIGGLVGLGASLFGNKSKVKMPDWVSTDTTKEQAGAIAGNQQNFEAASRLSSNVNQFNNDELEKFLRRAIPGYDDIVNNSSALIQSGLKGELPADVAAAINQKGASKAIAGGYGGGGMGRNLVARDLGRTSYDITQNALKNASDFITRQRTVGVTNLMGPESMFLTPAQRIATVSANNNAAYGAAVNKATADAEANPLLSNLSSFVSKTAGMAVGYDLTDQLANKYFSK